jgi:hypothetical protein
VSGPVKEGKEVGLANPIFVATFRNGATTRMTIATKLEPLDFQRGVNLAHLAMSLRASLRPEQLDGSGEIVAAHYETADGVKLADMPIAEGEPA